MSAGAIKPGAGSRPGIVGVGETPMLRHPEHGCSTVGLLARAIGLALADAGVAPGEVDGLGVASFSLRADRAIDLGWRLGLKLNWCMQDEMAAGQRHQPAAAGLVGAGSRAGPHYRAGDGDHFAGADFQGLVSDYNRSAREYLSPLGCVGPNPLFAMLTQRQMMRTGLRREDYGALCVAQRQWAVGIRMPPIASP
ncbi:hypothetical protein WJ968_05195 [Achromobacter xylosoxidans]